MAVDRSNLKCPWCGTALPVNTRPVKIVTRCKGCAKQMKLVGDQYQRCVKGKLADMPVARAVLDSIKKFGELPPPMDAGVVTEAAGKLLSANDPEFWKPEEPPVFSPDMIPCDLEFRDPAIHGDPSAPEPQGVIEAKTESIEIDPWDFRRKKR